MKKIIWTFISILVFSSYNAYANTEVTKNSDIIVELENKANSMLSLANLRNNVISFREYSEEKIVNDIYVARLLYITDKDDESLSSMENLKKIIDAAVNNVDNFIKKSTDKLDLQDLSIDIKPTMKRYILVNSVRKIFSEKVDKRYRWEGNIIVTLKSKDKNKLMQLLAKVDEDTVFIVNDLNAEFSPELVAKKTKELEAKLLTEFKQRSQAILDNLGYATYVINKLNINHKHNTEEYYPLIQDEYASKDYKSVGQNKSLNENDLHEFLMLKVRVDAEITLNH